MGGRTRRALRTLPLRVHPSHRTGGGGGWFSFRQKKNIQDQSNGLKENTDENDLKREMEALKSKLLSFQIITEALEKKHSEFENRLLSLENNEFEDRLLSLENKTRGWFY